MPYKYNLYRNFENVKFKQKDTYNSHFIRNTCLMSIYYGRTDVTLTKYLSCRTYIVVEAIVRSQSPMHDCC